MAEIQVEPEKQLTAPVPSLTPPAAPSAEDFARLSAAYVSVSLFAGGIVRMTNQLLQGAVVSPHSDKRMIVFRDEFESLKAALPDRYLQPALDEAVRLNAEIQQLLRARKEADSARACLQRIATDLTEFLPENGALAYAQIEEASKVLEAARDLAKTELREKPKGEAKYPHESQIAACYYPVKISNVDQLRAGDCIFHMEKKQTVYQHGNAQEETKVETVINLEGTVVMRPFGAQATLALRWHRALDMLRKMAGMCGKKQEGRKEGLQTAVEMLSAPSWLLSPVIATK